MRRTCIKAANFILSPLVGFFFIFMFFLFLVIDNAKVISPKMGEERKSFQLSRAFSTRNIEPRAECAYCILRIDLCVYTSIHFGDSVDGV